MSGTTRRTVLTMGGLAAVGGVSFFGWRSWHTRTRDSLLAKGQALLESGELREARGIGSRLMADYPDFLEGYLLSVWTLRALHERTLTSEVLGAAYELAPRGFVMLAEHVDHRLRGPEEPQKGFDSLEFLDRHLANFPEDANLVARARLVALAYLLGRRTLDGPQIQRVTRLTEETLELFHIEGVGTTGEHLDRAQALLALGRFDEAVEAARAGVAANTDKWMTLTMHWAVVTSLLHRGKDEEAWNELGGLLASLDDWPGTHFGMGKPLVELIQLTTAARFGRRTPTPPDYAERLARLEREGVRQQPSDDKTRELIGTLLAAMNRKDARTALSIVSELLALVTGDRGNGSELENQLTDPHTESMLLVVRGDLLLANADFEGAEPAFRGAQLLFPQDTWLDMKVGMAMYGSLKTDDFDPVRLPRTRGLP